MRTAPLRLLALFILFTFAAAPQAWAGDIVRKVIFPRGRNTVTYTDKLPREYAVYHAYVLRAIRGQRLSVKLSTAHRNASFSIYETKRFGPDEDTIFLQDPAIREYTAVLPITSEYSVQVYGVNGIDDAPSGTSYYIEIHLR